jgi:hypothetical protein
LQVEQLTRAFANLLQDTRERETLGEKAFFILEKNRGAAHRTTEQIAATFEKVLRNVAF